MPKGYRCSKDVFGYCVNSEPPEGKWLNYRGKDTRYFSMGACGFVPALCGHYRTLTEVLPDLSFLDKKRPPQSQNKKAIPSYL